MKQSTIGWVVVVLIVILGAIYWMGGRGPSLVPAEQGAPGQYVLKSASSPTLGTYLVAGNGMTLYSFKRDTTGVSNCTGQCLINWPAYTASAPFISDESVKGTVASIMRKDGGAQITYNGMPLYFWKLDQKPGDATGQGFNGVWFVVKP